MDIDSYAAWAQQVTPTQTATDLAVVALSMLGDAGEVADTIKDSLRDGGRLDEVRLAHELGDVIFYWTCLCARAGINPSKLLEQSRKSIEGRRSARSK